MMTETTTTPTFAELLATVATEPGKLERAFTTFHHFSLGNQLLALIQCMEREITPGPIATYPAWQKLGRQVRRGEKAIWLVQPVTCKRESVSESGETEIERFTRFTFRPKWFVLAQTDGADYVAPAPPAWDRARALAALDVAEIPFDHLNGNVQGFARGRGVAINPVAQQPFATLVHEIAHVVLGHTTGDAVLEDERTIRKDVREVEAESVALLVLGSLGQDGLEYCRGYVQAYLKGEAIDERMAQRIFKAADAILRAGLEAPAVVEEAA